MKNLFKEFFVRKETGSPEPNDQEKRAERRWNGMNPIQHDNALMNLLSAGKIKPHEVTELRMTPNFEDLPKHIKSALVEYWEDNRTK